uniref:Immunoglobulin C1-set domain-containing protein n=1 Tax=Cyprinus carpio TaxID=7962 RepID=A0A8C1VLK2_CYPCA
MGIYLLHFCTVILLLVEMFLFLISEICSLYYTYSAISKSLISEFYSSIFQGKKKNKCTYTCFKFIISVTFSEFCLLIFFFFFADLHVLQWKHGCAVELLSNGSIIFLQGTDEYAYDGETFNLSMHWKPLVLEHGFIWNRESVSSLERKCVETLTSFTDLQQEGKFITACEIISLIVHIRICRITIRIKQQILVCLATGFYPKQVQMEIRHHQTPVPDEQLTSHGLRPNADGSFQLMKSLQILPSERSHYQCVVKHQTLTEPLIISWDESNVLLPVIVGVIVALVVLAIIVLVFYLLRKCVKYQSEYYSFKDSSSSSRSEHLNSFS